MGIGLEIITVKFQLDLMIFGGAALLVCIFGPIFGTNDSACRKIPTGNRKTFFISWKTNKNGLNETYYQVLLHEKADRMIFESVGRVIIRQLT